MKKTLFLFIPMLSYSKITYEDVMSINSEDIFKRVMIENGYEKIYWDDDIMLKYGYNTTTDSMSNSFCLYNTEKNKYLLTL